MNRNTDAAPTRSLAERCMAFLHHVAGAAPDDLRHLDQRARMQYATLGAVFLLNLILLSAAWIKVGVTYFGTIGIVVPGLAVPALFVLGLDRLVAMRNRRLVGELEGFNLPGLVVPPWELRLRLGTAFALAALTTFTFMLSMSSDSVHQRQNADAQAANRALRQELTERIRVTHDLRERQAHQRQTLLLAERAALDARLDALDAKLAEYEARALRSREEAAMEVGGLDNRQAGAGPRYQARIQIAQQNDSVAAAARAEQRQAQRERQTLDKELAAIPASFTQILSDLNRALANLDEDLHLDERYIKPRRGLFSDATAFVRLYADPDEALGRWLLTALIVGVLCALETAALIALALNPSSPLEVLRMARNREQAAQFVAQSETAVAAARAANPGLHVYDASVPPPRRTAGAGAALGAAAAQRAEI